MNELISFNDSEKMANIMAKSGLLPSALRSKPNDIFVLIQMGNELGLKPMQAINGVHVIQGKPTIAPQTMLALIYSRHKGPYIEVVEDNQKKVVKCTMKRSKDESGYTSTWDMDRAKQMGLIGKDNWNKQPMTMLKWRAVSDAAKIIFPDIIQGFYTPEEMNPDLSVDSEGSPIGPIKVENLSEPQPIPEKKEVPEEKKQPSFVKIYSYILQKVGTAEETRKLWEEMKLEKKEYTQQEFESIIKEIDRRCE